MVIEYRHPEDMDPLRLKDILKYKLQLSTRLINKLKVKSCLLINGIPSKTIDMAYSGDLITVRLEEDTLHYTEAENIPIDILYEDDWFLAVNKPAGIPVHPSAGHTAGTLANAVQWHYQNLRLMTKTRPVNRLDRDTSGVTLFAKHSHAQDQIIRQMKLNQVYKAYLGIIEGEFSPDHGTIDLPIMRKPGSVMERIIHPDGDRSITHYQTLVKKNGLSLIRYVLETGRTHQIRIHSLAMGHPLIGDWLYGNNSSPLINRQALHSYVLRFTHPSDGSLIEITAPTPEDMTRIIG